MKSLKREKDDFEPNSEMYGEPVKLMKLMKYWCDVVITVLMLAKIKLPMYLHVVSLNRGTPLVMLVFLINVLPL